MGFSYLMVQMSDGKIAAAKRVLSETVFKIIPSKSSSVSQHCPSDIFEKLCNLPDKVRKFDLDGSRMWVRLINAHDGDTMTVGFEFASQFYRTNVRLIGLDTPEIRSKDPNEKLLAVQARNRVLNWAAPALFEVDGMYEEKQVMEKLKQTPVVLFVECREGDKYGRPLVKVFKTSVATDSINDMLLQDNQADTYEGGTKLRTWQ